MGMGPLLLARIGMPKGSAAHDRSFLTAVGPAANLASKLQDFASAGQIYTDHLVQQNAPAGWKQWFVDRTPAGWRGRGSVALSQVRPTASGSTQRNGLRPSALPKKAVHTGRV